MAILVCITIGAAFVLGFYLGQETEHAHIVDRARRDPAGLCLWVRQQPDFDRLLGRQP